MKVNKKLFCSSILLCLIMTFPAAVEAESALPLNDKTKTLFEQLQDLELMQRNVVECYQAERRTRIKARLTKQSERACAQLDGKLMNRVFGHLSGTPEYKRFVTEYQTILQSPDDRPLNTERLFSEYMLLLESGRTRLMTQWKSPQESLTQDRSDQVHGGLALPIRVNRVTFGQSEGLQRPESARVVPAVWVRARKPLDCSTPLAPGRKRLPWAMAHGMDQSGSPGASAPTLDVPELDALVVQAPVLPKEEVSVDYHKGLAKRSRLTRTNHQLSNTAEKNAGIRDNSRESESAIPLWPRLPHSTQ